MKEKSFFSHLIKREREESSRFFLRSFSYSSPGLFLLPPLRARSVSTRSSQLPVLTKARKERKREGEREKERGLSSSPGDRHRPLWRQSPVLSFFSNLGAWIPLLSS